MSLSKWIVAHTDYRRKTIDTITCLRIAPACICEIFKEIIMSNIGISFERFYMGNDTRKSVLGFAARLITAYLRF